MEARQVKPYTVYLIGSLVIGIVAGGVCNGIMNLGFWAIIGTFHLTIAFMYVFKEVK